MWRGVEISALGSKGTRVGVLSDVDGLRLGLDAFECADDEEEASDDVRSLVTVASDRGTSV